MSEKRESRGQKGRRCFEGIARVRGGCRMSRSEEEGGRTANKDPPTVLVRQNAYIQRRRRLQNRRVGKGDQADLLESIVGVRNCTKRGGLACEGGTGGTHHRRVARCASFRLKTAEEGRGRREERTELADEHVAVVVEVGDDHTHQTSNVALREQRGELCFL
jgi:hypothetical protein